MKLFFAWSGPASEQLAEFMRDWIPSVIQAVRPFMSTQDIRKGQRWANEIGARLNEADFALLCLTPSNLKSHWIHFEAGALSNIESRRVSALLLDVSPTQIEFPLQQFQHTRLTKRDLWQLVRDLNSLCKTPLDEAPLRKTFERSYPEVEAEIEKLRGTLADEQRGEAEPARTTDAILSDVLAVQQGLAAKIESIHAKVQGVPARKLAAPRRSVTPRRRSMTLPAVRPSRIAQSFGEVFRDLRHARGLSLHALSSRARVAPTYIMQIERGAGLPTLAMVYLLARALDLTPALLLRRLDESLGIRSAESHGKARLRVVK